MAVSEETSVHGGTLSPPSGRVWLNRRTAPFRSRRRRRLLLTADVAATGVASVVAVSGWAIIRPRGMDIRTAGIFVALSLVVALTTVVRSRAAAGRVSERLADRRSRCFGVGLDIGVAGVILVLAGALGAFGRSASPVVELMVAAAAILSVMSGRELMRMLTGPLRVVLVGAGTEADELHSRLDRAGGVELTELAVDPAAACMNPAALQELCDYYRADELLMVLPHCDAAASRPDIDVLRRLSLRLPAQVVVHVSPEAAPLLFEVGSGPGFMSRVVKRTSDVLISLLALTLVIPLLLVLMICIGFETGLPVLFRQRRLGRDRQPFQIFKLRMMHGSRDGRRDVAAGRRTPFSHVADPLLVTRVGRLLRRSALDELPQLVNVLRGEMSLVGPRPFVPEECDSLPAWAEARFRARPGMSGMWQVCGQHAVTLDELCWIDLFYVSCWSPGTDLRILLRTPARLLRGSV